MPRNQYETMNLLIASTKCALVDKLVEVVIVLCQH